MYIATDIEEGEREGRRERERKREREAGRERSRGGGGRCHKDSFSALNIKNRQHYIIIHILSASCFSLLLAELIYPLQRLSRD